MKRAQEHTMYVYIARQPVFNGKKRIFAYELLFRKTQGLGLGELSGDRATSSLLSTIFFTEGIEKIVGNKPCLINFTENLLIQEIASSFPKKKMIVEILENVSPRFEVVEACRNLSKMGYRLALDDFIFKADLMPLIELADIIKFDYKASTPEEIEMMLREIKPFGVKYLAEKVETYAEFEHARRLGFHYFQGYFFARPESLRIREVAASKASQFNLLNELAGSEPDLRRLERIIETDVALSYKLLRYINSAYFSLVKTVDSVHHAIVYLGEKELRRFATLAIISELAEDKPTELVRLSLIRARFCEQLGECRGYPADNSPLFSLGLFSLIDAILDVPMAILLEKLPLSKEINDALISNEGPFFAFLDAVIAYEQGREEDCLKSLRQLMIKPDNLYGMYLEAIRFSSMLQ